VPPYPPSMRTSSTAEDVGKLALAAVDAAAVLGISRAQFWKLHSSGRLPAPVYLGTKAPRWRLDELRRWLDAGAPERSRWEKIRPNRGGML
jgi:predicted DNA-binding transcriptional regulator AlpA